MAYRSSRANGGGGTDTPTVTAPLGVQADDIVILIAASDSPSASFTGTWPTGFTQFFDDDLASPDGQSVGIAWKRLTGADTSYTLTSIGSSNDWAIVAVAFSGRSTSSDPVCVHATNTSSNTSPVSATAPTLTAVAGDDLLFAVGFDTSAGGIANNSTTPPSGYTEQQDEPSASGWAVIEAATKDNVSAGATGSVSSSTTLTSGVAGWAAYHVRIPAAAGGGGTDATVTAVPMDATGGIVAPTVSPGMIAHGAASRSHATDALGHTAASAFTWTHTPTGTPKGVVVAITQPLGSTDEVSAVTYGGVALSRVRSTARTTTEAMRVYLYFLGSGIPTGAQTVSVTSTGTTAKQGHCFTMTTTDGSDTVVDADNGSDLGIIANPSLTVTHSGTLNSWVGYGIHGYGGAAVPNLTASAARQANLTLGFGHDPGAATAETYYRTGAAAASSSTYGYTTLASDDQVIAALVVKPLVVVSATVTAVPMAGTGGIATTAVAANYTATSPVVDGTGAVPAPVVAASSAVTSPATAGTGTLPVPSVTAFSGVTVVAVPLAGSGDVVAPTVTGSSAVTSPALAGTGTIPPLSSIASVEVTAALITVTGAMPTPTVSGSAGGNITGIPIDGTGAIPAPSVSAGWTVSAVAAAVSGDVVSPSAAAGATITATPADAVSAATPPTVTGGSAGQVSALHMPGVGALMAPAVSAGATVTGVPAAGTGQAAAPSLALGYTLTAPTLTGAGTLPTVGLATSSGVTAVPALGSGAVLAPSAAARTDVLAPPATAYGDMPNPVAGADGEVVAVPAVALGALQPGEAHGLVSGLYVGAGRAAAGRLSAAPAGRVLVAPAGTLSP